MALPLVIAGGTALAAWLLGCGSDMKPPSLATGEEGEDVRADGAETETTVSSDAVAHDDSEVGEAGADTPQGIDGTSIDQTGEETVVYPTTDKFICRITAKDCYGMEYGMFVESEDYVTYDNSGFAGIMKFQNTLAVETELEVERQEKPASEWMQEGLTLPSYAQNLTGRYDVSVNTSSGLLTCLNLDAESLEPQDATLFPMTWMDDTNNLPELIAGDAHNEVYPSVKPGLDMQIECGNESCSVLSGTATVNIGDNFITAGCADTNITLTIECVKE